MRFLTLLAVLFVAGCRGDFVESNRGESPPEDFEGTGYWLAFMVGSDQVAFSRNNKAYLMHLNDKKSRAVLCHDLLRYAPDGRFRGARVYVETFGEAVRWREEKRNGARWHSDMSEYGRFLRVNGFDPDDKAEPWKRFALPTFDWKTAYAPLSDEIVRLKGEGPDAVGHGAAD